MNSVSENRTVRLSHDLDLLDNGPPTTPGARPSFVPNPSSMGETGSAADEPRVSVAELREVEAEFNRYAATAVRPLSDPLQDAPAAEIGQTRPGPPLQPAS